MGRATHSILSGTSRRTGLPNVHGVGVSRARPATRSSSTEPQNAHRELFRFAVVFLGLYKSFARLFFGKRKELVTPYNPAQANVLQNIRLTGRDIIINYNQVLISKGNLLKMIPGSISAGTAQAVTVTWTNNAPTAGSNESDLCPAFVYLPARRDGPFFSGVAVHQATTVTVNLLPFYADEEGTAACNPKYMGAATLTWSFSKNNTSPSLSFST